MNDNEAVVRIVGDASGVRPSVDQAKGEVEGLAPMLAQLNASFADLAASMRSSMAAGTASTAEMAQEMHHLEEETERERASLKEMALSVHEGVESFNGFKAALGEIAEVWMAAFAIERIADWAKEFAESAEHVEHLAQTFGMTTNQVQQLGAIATATGIPLDAITRGMQVLDRNAVQAAEGNSAVANAFKAVGISANDGMTQMERMEAVADKFRDMDDGPKKAALAMELFGRSGAQLIPILNLGAEGLKEMADKAKEFDVANTAVSASAQEKGVALAESINESKLAFQGVTNVLGDAFAPVLKEITDSLNLVIKAFIDSYNEGGVVAVIFMAIKEVIEEVGAVINALVGIFAALWDAVVEIVTDIAQSLADLFGVSLPNNVKAGQVQINIFKDAFVVVKDAIIVAIEIIKGALVFLIDELRLFAVQAKDALTLQWGQMDADWKAGTDRIATHVEESAKRIKAAMTEAGAAIQAAIHGEALPTEKTGIKTARGGGSFDPDLGKTHKEKDKKPKDDLVQQLDEQLKAKEVAWSMEQDAQGSAQAYSLQSIADYWKAALERDDLSQKDRLAIEEKYLAAHGQLVKQDIDKVLDGYKGQLAEFKNNADQRLAIATAAAAFILGKYGAESTEYAAAQAQIKQVAQQAAEQRIALAKQAAAEIEKLSNDELARQDAAAKFRVTMGVATQAQLLAQERQFEDARYQIQQQALAQQKAATDPTRDPVKFAQVNNQLADLERQHQAKLTQIDQQAILQRTAIERTAINSTAGLWGTNIAKLVTLQQGFAATLHSLYTGMVSVISTALGSIIEKWLAQHLAAILIGNAANRVSAASEIGANAAIAGSAAYASTAAIPIVGPELAPAAAASAYAGAMSFIGSLAVPSGAGGIWDVDGGLTMLHENEMVLPAWAAQPLRSMIGGGGVPSPAAATDPGGGGDFHYHDHSGRLSPEDIMANRGVVAAAMKRAHREGHFAGTKISFG